MHRSECESCLVAESRITPKNLPCERVLTRTPGQQAYKEESAAGLSAFLGLHGCPHGPGTTALQKGPSAAYASCQAHTFTPERSAPLTFLHINATFNPVWSYSRTYE